MPPAAHSALVASIIASALGALVMCVLVWRYGFTSAADPKAPEHDRHIAMTRFGHAAAGACFAVTAVMAAVVMATARPAAPTPTPVATVVAQPDPRLAERLVSLAATVHALLGRAESSDERMTRVESGMKRLSDDVGQANARSKQVERQLATRPAVISVPAPAPRPAAVTPPPSPAPPAAAAPAAPRPSASPRMEPTRQMAPEADRERWVAPIPEPPAPETLPRTPPITRVVPPSAPGPPPTAAAVRPAPAPSAADSRPATEPNLIDKVKSDWQTIRRGLENAGEDFKAAMRDVRRRIGGRD